MKNRGVSTIVATVLIVLFSVMAVTVLWVGISPVVNLNLRTYDTQLSIETAGGYTFYDKINGVVSLQVESKGEDSPDYVQTILGFDDGSEVMGYRDAPALNSRSTYYLNVSKYADLGKYPVSISVAPIFVDEGRNILGDRGREIDAPLRGEDEVYYDGKDVLDADAIDTSGDVSDISGEPTGPLCNGELAYESPVNVTCDTFYSSSSNSYFCSNSVDGSLSSGWFSSTRADPQNITFDLGVKKCINGVGIYPWGFSVYANQKTNIYVSSDEVNWVVVATNQNLPLSGEWNNLTFDEVVGRYIRLDFYDTSSYTSVVEFEVEVRDYS